MKRKLIRIIDKSVWNGPTTMEELRALSKAMPEPISEEQEAARLDRPQRVDRDVVLHLLAEGQTGASIAKLLDCSVSMVSRIKSGQR
jgi:DNA-binding NarL/FixJ family response regulator